MRFKTLQHANEDVEKMILGNKCDMEEKRVVSKERGEAVSIVWHLYCTVLVLSTCIHVSQWLLKNVVGIWTHGLSCQLFTVTVVPSVF